MCVCVRHVCACVCVGVCVCVGLYIYMFLSPGFNCVPFSAINDMIMKSFSFDSNKPPSKQPLAAKKFWRLFTQSPYGPFSQVLVFATHMSTIDPPPPPPNSLYVCISSAGSTWWACASSTKTNAAQHTRTRTCTHTHHTCAEQSTHVFTHTHTHTYRGQVSIIRSSMKARSCKMCFCECER